MTAVSDDALVAVQPPPLVARLAVTDLFGRYNHSLDAPTAHGGRLLLLHGENGAGKTTLLSMLWNLLSPAENRGHRTALAQTPFRQFEVLFSNSTRFHLWRESELVGDFHLRIERNGHDDISTRFRVDADQRVRSSNRYKVELEGRVDTETQRMLAAAEIALGSEWSAFETIADEERGQRDYLDLLRNQHIQPLFLADDRALNSDDPQLQAIRDADRPRGRIYEDVVRGMTYSVARELQITLTRLNEWLRTLTLSGQNIGSAGANGIYRDVLTQLAGPTGTTSDRGIKVTEAIEEIAAQSIRFEEFGLVPQFPASEFLALLRRVDSGASEIAERVLTPYIESLRARLAALADAERLVRSLVETTNSFLTDKLVRFSPSAGLWIETDTGERLSPDSLSSGERQILMLLSTTVLARRDSRLFIIDEPELSLGVRWQRAVLDALLELTEDSPLQFIVATHSIEIMSGHAESLIQVGRVRDEWQ